MEKEIEIFKIFKDNRIFSKNGKLRCGALWEVSNFGSVRRNGEDFLPYSNNGKYLEFGGHYFVHRAVAELFIPNPENKPTVDHLNRRIHDNRASNLRWVTMKEQAANRANKWVFNPTTAHLTRVHTYQVPDYIAKGYVKGIKIKK